MDATGDGPFADLLISKMADVGEPKGVGIIDTRTQSLLSLYTEGSDIDLTIRKSDAKLVKSVRMAMTFVTQFNCPVDAFGTGFSILPSKGSETLGVFNFFQRITVRLGSELLVDYTRPDFEMWLAILRSTSSPAEWAEIQQNIRCTYAHPSQLLQGDAALFEVPTHKPRFSTVTRLNDTTVQTRIDCLLPLPIPWDALPLDPLGDLSVTLQFQGGAWEEHTVYYDSETVTGSPALTTTPMNVTIPNTDPVSDFSPTDFFTLAAAGGQNAETAVWNTMGMSTPDCPRLIGAGKWFGTPYAIPNAPTNADGSPFQLNITSQGGVTDPTNTVGASGAFLYPINSFCLKNCSLLSLAGDDHTFGTTTGLMSSDAILAGSAFSPYKQTGIFSKLVRCEPNRYWPDLPTSMYYTTNLANPAYFGTPLSAALPPLQRACKPVVPPYAGQSTAVALRDVWSLQLPWIMEAPVTPVANTRQPSVTLALMPYETLPHLGEWSAFGYGISLHRNGGSRIPTPFLSMIVNANDLKANEPVVTPGAWMYQNGLTYDQTTFTFANNTMLDRMWGPDNAHIIVPVFGGGYQIEWYNSLLLQASAAAADATLLSAPILAMPGLQSAVQHIIASCLFPDLIMVADTTTPTATDITQTSMSISDVYLKYENVPADKTMIQAIQEQLMSSEGFRMGCVGWKWFANGVDISANAAFTTIINTQTFTAAEAYGLIYGVYANTAASPFGVRSYTMPIGRMDIKVAQKLAMYLQRQDVPNPRMPLKSLVNRPLRTSDVPTFNLSNYICFPKGKSPNVQPMIDDAWVDMFSSMFQEKHVRLDAIQTLPLCWKPLLFNDGGYARVENVEVNFTFDVMNIVSNTVCNTHLVHSSNVQISQASAFIPTNEAISTAVALPDRKLYADFTNTANSTSVDYLKGSTRLINAGTQQTLLVYLMLNKTYVFTTREYDGPTSLVVLM